MITKLKLQIDLNNKWSVIKGGNLFEEYQLYITVLDKDERFQADNVGETLSHNGTGSFVIKSLWDEKHGSILHNGLLIPKMDRLGIEYNKLFNDDMERYHFLKKLYTAIEEWANYWKGFKYDDKSIITVKDNIWEVTCDSVYSGSIDYFENYVG